jgi:hypothetical protein
MLLKRPLFVKDGTAVLVGFRDEERVREKLDLRKVADKFTSHLNLLITPVELQQDQHISQYCCESC